ncbi:hypothetical protein FOZ61_010533 [Perkinsus olseni]|uniref:Uncharacterized protein n=1 Tax=Perkinsus olseni TaxID=32597 RepID=A0A7J6KY51_PEROL|nr:hypothetical protein FOZ61_010533 [Perkinsus olseni]
MLTGLGTEKSVALLQEKFFQIDLDDVVDSDSYIVRVEKMSIREYGSGKCCMILLQKGESKKVLPHACEIPQSGSFYAFTLRGVRLGLTLATFELSCGGQLCNSSCGPSSQGKGCVCLYRGRKAGYVACSTVHCKAFPGVCEREKCALVKGLAVTKLLTRKSIWREADPPDVFALREAARKVGKFVNKRGGWVVHGWAKGGVITEESAGDGDINMYKEIQKIHVVSIAPERMEELSEEIEELKMKRFKKKKLSWRAGKRVQLPIQNTENDGERDTTEGGSDEESGGENEALEEEIGVNGCVGEDNGGEIVDCMKHMS